MSGQGSIATQLTRRLTVVGLLGGIAMTILLALDFDRFLVSDERSVPWRTELNYIVLFVLVPVATMTTATVVVSRWIVNRSFGALEDAARLIDVAAESERSFRLDLSRMPTEMLAGARAINRILARLDELAEKREIFAGQVAHELKTPMATLLLELEGLGTDHAVRLKADVQRMDRLLDQLLVMAHLETHAISPVHPGPVSLAAVAADVQHALGMEAAGSGRRLEVSLGKECPIIGQRESIFAAIRNLTENALRVTPSGGHVTLITGPGRCVRIRDGGPGLSEAELERLTKPYARAGHASRQGAGLGLAIAAQVARLHGGTLSTNPEKRELRLTFPPPPTPVRRPSEYAVK